ncbi:MULTISPECIES: lipopolysaccharide assembly protein LapA domain-containing protein [Mycolicibacterium]|uniref:lipopolysaccharide assembly protein LapA domain-containing protein n=1 Tax=Mycobacteriaceae TaxID=1762 RepID=UPI00107F6847|nr:MULTISPECIES: lipopolysaccharide assembly protein LapA domain-containing protein [Mycolicibacterium]MCX8558689.1 lipopolysaccharide assembly protein LapA domain-containing protein [Mycolicibacterium mucogenicum]
MSSDHATSPDPSESTSSPAAVPAEPPAPKSPKPDSAPAKKPKTPESAVKFTRTAALWSALVLGFLILILLLVFVIQNDTPVDIVLLGWKLHQVQLGVTILLAAIAGGLLTFAVATTRILQLRLAAKKNLKAGL